MMYAIVKENLQPIFEILGIEYGDEEKIDEIKHRKDIKVIIMDKRIRKYVDTKKIIVYI